MANFTNVTVVNTLDEDVNEQSKYVIDMKATPLANITSGMNLQNLSSNHNRVSDYNDEAYQVDVSPETINLILIVFMACSCIGLIIGFIFRKDFGGIKTKCCRTKRNPAEMQKEMQEGAFEDIPLSAPDVK